MRQGRPSISERVARVPSSRIRRFLEIAVTRPNIISLGMGEPDSATLLPSRQAGIASPEKGGTHYTSHAGILELREAVASHLAEPYDVVYDPEREILITVGVSERLHRALTAVADPGDEVLVPERCFVACKAEVT